ncbi:hypothetical protein [Corynebacterium glutamicum]|uniref:hypothetical protein n=1 Tax=Corynebacterium glutamicum TaxID=1718 RepID=UPI0005C4FE8A|nr:hypothetical protein [Corynebacterium glutamicum]
MATSHHTPTIFNATVTKGIIPDGDINTYSSANYGISPAPGWPTQASFRFREDAQEYADKVNAEYGGMEIFEDSVFDLILDGIDDASRDYEAHRRQSPTVWADKNGINIAGFDGEMSMSDADAFDLVKKLLEVIDSNECEGQ